MAYKLIILVGLTMMCTSFAAQSNRYPAGVHPSLCPHYPYCDNTVLAGFAHAAAAPLFEHQSFGVAPGYPAGLSPHACPNYPFCSHQIPQEAIHYRRRSISDDHYRGEGSNVYYTPIASAYTGAARYPAGVNPASCPNYPYCH